MRKIKEVLRLRFGLGLRQDQIAQSCSIGQATVHRYLERAAAAGLSWPLPDDCDDDRLGQLLFPTRPGQPNPQVRPLPDFAEAQRQLQAHKHVTLQRLSRMHFHPAGGQCARRAVGFDGPRSAYRNNSEHRPSLRVSRAEESGNGFAWR
jgi:transposase